MKNMIYQKIKMKFNQIKLNLGQLTMNKLYKSYKFSEEYKSTKHAEISIKILKKNAY